MSLARHYIDFEAQDIKKWNTDKTKLAFAVNGSLSGQHLPA